MLCLKGTDGDEDACKGVRQMAASICPVEWVSAKSRPAHLYTPQPFSHHSRGALARGGAQALLCTATWRRRPRAIPPSDSVGRRPSPTTPPFPAVGTTTQTEKWDEERDEGKFGGIQFGGDDH